VAYDHSNNLEASVDIAFVPCAFHNEIFHRVLITFTDKLKILCNIIIIIIILAVLRVSL
jgi:hypothetical protein